jgi:hypothetical protein
VCRRQPDAGRSTGHHGHEAVEIAHGASLHVCRCVPSPSMLSCMTSPARR